MNIGTAAIAAKNGKSIHISDIHIPVPSLCVNAVKLRRRHG
ncbi:Uncharacterized protein dnl_11850 [Desulfonema limicola]|uniref:Uncharacterized protein n=1 Tax=Desulfonema limicola TaxID=45656 RepID=A0A975B538_9BACT|nr:Uncharacterized protein dnl_11850 [Desulfonema limicola]